MNHNFRPQNPLLVPRFGGITTFSRLPLIYDHKDQPLDVVVTGAPFDGGTSYRPGARFGPRSIREASVLCRNFNPEIDVDLYEKLKVADVGDLPINPLNMQKTFDLISSNIEEHHKLKRRHILLGGDHSIVLPELRAMHKIYKDFTLVHFDAHTDTADQAWGEKYHHGTPIRRAIDEGLLQGGKIFQIGIRGPLTSKTQEDYGVEQGISVLSTLDFQNEKKRNDFFKKIHSVAGKNPVMITFDIDAIDPAYAPGTGTPVVGGLTSLQALEAVRSLKGLNIRGADLVEVSPAYDHAEITSLLAAALVFEFLSLMAVSKS